MNNIIIDKLKYEELEQYKNLIDNCFDSSASIETYKEMYSTDKTMK